MAGRHQAAGATGQPGIAAKHPGHRWRWALLALFSALLLAGALLTLAVTTQAGTRATWRLLTGMMPATLSGELAGGTLSRGLQLRQLHYQDAQRSVRIDTLQSSWQVSLSPLKLTVHRLALGKIEAVLLPSPSEPLVLPEHIRLPLALDIKRVSVETLLVKQDTVDYAFSDILLHASSDKLNHRLLLDKATTPLGELTLQLQLNGQRPFATAGDIRLSGKQQGEAYTAHSVLSGSLEQLQVVADIAAKNMQGQLTVAATPFAPIPFTQAIADVRSLNLATFSASAPKTDIRIQATMLPVAGSIPATDSSTPADLSKLRVVGPISIVNSMPGAIDQSRLPLASLSTQASLDANTQTLSGLVIKLAGGASLSGNAQNQSPLGGKLSLQASKLDLAALHGALKPTSLQGPLLLAFGTDTQAIKLTLADQSLSLSADAVFDPKRMVLNSAVLQAGSSKLAASGSMIPDASAAYALKGTLSNFNPGLFLNTLQADAKPAGAKARSAGQKQSNTTTSRVVPASINASIELSGALKPTLSALAKFDIQDSRYDHLPMSGSGRLQLLGERLMSSNASLLVAGNQLHINGAFGARGDKLLVKVDAPALDRLGYGLSGRLQLDGDFAGSLQQPVVNAVYSASKLQFGEHSLAQADGRLHMQGLPTLGADVKGASGKATNAQTASARLSFALNARGYHSSLAQLDTLQADIAGSYASHSLKLAAQGKINGETLDLSMAAQGRLQQLPQTTAQNGTQSGGLAWSGMLNQLEHRSLPRLHLARPVALSVAPQHLSLGATSLSIEKAQLELKQFSYDAGAISSEGTFKDLNVAHLLAIRHELTGTAAPVQTDLVLDASWHFKLAAQGDGFLQIARKSGDVGIPGEAGVTMLGLDTLRVRADLKGSALALQAAVNAPRYGNVSGKGSIALQAENGVLTVQPQSALRGDIQLSIPQLQKIGALAGPSILLGGNIQANLDLQGSAATPQLSGHIDGSDLALTLYDQGIKLRDGVARIALRNNVLQMEKVEFYGGQGVLRMVGSIPIDSQRPELTATIVADKLQLLADPAAQLTLSGQAKVSNAAGSLAINGKFTVDNALFNLPETSAPKLDDDVVIIRDTDAAKAATPQGQKVLAKKQASPYSPAVRLDIDLGKDFRFVGQGADLLLVGVVSIKSLPQQAPEAQGTVRVSKGTFEAFGAKLAIERGIINFQGPLDNPNINILAMRRKQEVAAGVEVTGTAELPRIALVSEPDVPNEQKLSWLVFGRASGGDAKGQAAAQGAALAVMNKLAGGKSMASKVGLDDVSFATGASGQQLLSLGKNISDKLSLGYKQGLSSLDSAVELTYLLSRHWSVVTSGGRMLGLNVFYSNRFDRVFDKSDKPEKPKSN